MAGILDWISNRAMLAAILAAGFLSGLGVWKFQAARLDALQAEYSAFVAQTKAEGQTAQRIADMSAQSAKNAKEKADHDYQIQIDALAADADRLRKQRSRSGYLPAAPASSRDPEIVCFNLAKFSEAIGRLDQELSGIVERCDAGTEALNVAKEWAQTIGEKKPR